MTKTVTQNDLVRYVYGEVSPEEKLSVEVQKICDTEIDESLEDMMHLKSVMDTIVYQPQTSSLEAILKYSKQKRQSLQTV
ncbi:MAG: hypothetical protein GY827_11075 [Cytophagales bacterium]|nr:hypothetical protein [Cytophagales bacterium]